MCVPSQRAAAAMERACAATTPKASPNCLDAAGLQKPANIATEIAVAVEYDVAVGTRERKSFSQLLNDPIAGRVSRYIEMQNPPPMMLDHKKSSTARGRSVSGP